MNTCKVDGCIIHASKRGMCNKHYLRWWKHGDPNHEPPNITACRVDGCTKATRSRSIDLCEMHYCRIRRNGDPLTIKDTRRPDALYRAAHARVARDRGKAKTHQCVDCGRQAQHWSYTHTDPDALTSDTGQPYSLSPEHYSPRCARCHAIFDGTGANQYNSVA